MASVDRAKDALTLVTDVRGVNPAKLPRDLGQLDEIRRAGEARGRHQERGRKPHRPFFHRLGDELLHRLELLRSRSGLTETLDVGPDLFFADIRRDVRRHVLGF